MSRPVRLGLFAVAGCGLAAVLVIGFAGLPAFGHAHELYGALVNRTEDKLRHATDIVTALNFDIRAFDTLGEEFILFTSVSGVALLLRHLREEEEEIEVTPGIEEHRFAGASDGLKLASLVLIPLLVAFGAYLVLHGQLTPGGGFQGGVVLAAGPVAILLAGRYLSMRHVAPERLTESADARGRSRLRADRSRRADLRRRLPEEHAPVRYPWPPALRGDDAAEQPRGGARGGGGVPDDVDRVPRSDHDRSTERMSFLPFAVAVWLFVVGLWGVVSSRNLVRTVLSLTIVQSSTYLVALGRRLPGRAPRRRSSPTFPPPRDWSIRSSRCSC